MESVTDRSQMPAPSSKSEESPPSYADSSMGTVNYPQSDPAYGYSFNPPAAGHNTWNPPSSSNTNNVVLVQPGIAMPAQEPYVVVPDYFVLSIVSVFFCLCLGIFSIVKASHARQMKAAGRYQTALRDSMNARNTAIAAIIIGAILSGISIALHLTAAQSA